MTNTLGRMDIREPEDVDQGSRALDTFTAAVNNVYGKGLLIPQKPNNGYDGDMPKDITGLDDDDLGDLLSKIADYCGFVEWELSKAKVEMNIARDQLEFTMARIRVGYKDQFGERMTVKDKDDLVSSDPRVIQAKSRAIYTEAVHDLTKVILNKAQRNWETVSRRITQRGQEVERIKREGNVSSIQHAGRSFRR